MASEGYLHLSVEIAPGDNADLVWSKRNLGRPCRRCDGDGYVVRLLEVDNVVIPVARVCPDSTRDLFDPSDDGSRHVSHFATCPNADEWRTS